MQNNCRCQLLDLPLLPWDMQNGLTPSRSTCTAHDSGQFDHILATVTTQYDLVHLQAILSTLLTYCVFYRQQDEKWIRSLGAIQKLCHAFFRTFSPPLSHSVTPLTTPLENYVTPTQPPSPSAPQENPSWSAQKWKSVYCEHQTISTSVFANCQCQCQCWLWSLVAPGWWQVNIHVDDWNRCVCFWLPFPPLSHSATPLTTPSKITRQKVFCRCAARACLCLGWKFDSVT